MGGQCHAPAALPPGKIRQPLYRTLDGPQGRSGRWRIISPLTRCDTRTVQPVASRYTDWAIPTPIIIIIIIIIIRSLLGNPQYLYFLFTSRHQNTLQTHNKKILLFSGLWNATINDTDDKTRSTTVRFRKWVRVPEHKKNKIYRSTNSTCWCLVLWDKQGPDKTA